MSTMSGDAAESTSNNSVHSSPSDQSSRTTAPKIKFLCSHGGKILPRLADGSLRYTGGDTRVISVHRDITYNDLMKKLHTSLVAGNVTLKYKLLSEDLDILITVKSDEDLLHMLEEYDRHELKGTQKLRTILFPTKPIIIKHHTSDLDCLEQRYINILNNIVVHAPPTPRYNRNLKPLALNTSQTSFSISSACSSPRTPPETTIPTVGPDVINPEISSFHGLNTMPRAQSSPDLSNLGPTPQTFFINPTPILTNQQYYLYHHQPQPQPQLQPQPVYQYIYYAQPQHQSQSSPRPPPSPQPHKSSVTTDHVMRVRSAGPVDYQRHPMEHSVQQAQGRQSWGGVVVYQRGSANDEYYGNNRYERESPTGSPLAPSPLQNNTG